MDRPCFNKYLRRFPFYSKGAGTSLPPAVGRIVDAVFLPAGRNGVARSWLESSISSAEPGAARFIHYYRLADGLKKSARAKAWSTAYRRFLGMLEEFNSGGGGFGLDKAAAVGEALFGRLEKHSAVIASAEWLPGKEGFSKATVYVAMEHPLGRAAASDLARVSGGSAGWLAGASGRDMGLFGADFYPGGAVGFKVYRRYLPAYAPLDGAAARMAARLNRSSGFVSTHMAYKYDRAAKKVFLDKTHFNLAGGVSPALLASGAGARAKKAVALFKARAADLSRITCVGVKPAGGYFEIYFA